MRGALLLLWGLLLPAAIGCTPRARLHVADSLLPTGGVRTSVVVGLSGCPGLAVDLPARLVCPSGDVSLGVLPPTSPLAAAVFDCANTGTYACLHADGLRAADRAHAFWECGVEAAVGGAPTLLEVLDDTGAEPFHVDSVPGVGVHPLEGVATWLVPAMQRNHQVVPDYEGNVRMVMGAGGDQSLGDDGGREASNRWRANITDPFMRGVVDTSVRHMHALSGEVSMEDVAPVRSRQTPKRHRLDKHHVTKRFVSSFAEVHSKVESTLRAGVQSKEVFALIVDQIMNHLPEIMVQILIAVMRSIFVELMGQLMVIIMPPLIIPNDGAVPPSLPGLPPPVEKPAPPCECQTKAGEKYTPEFGRFQSKCACNDGDTLLETAAGAASGVGAAARVGLGEPKLGPLERITEKAKITVPEGLEGEALPKTSEGVYKALYDSLSNMLSQSVSHGVSLHATHNLIGTLSETITTSLTKILNHQATVDITKAASKVLIPALTLSLGSSIGQSLTRTPQADYYCKFCSEHKQYCDHCKAAADYSAELDRQIVRYGRHFGSHYASLYGGDAGVEIAELVLSGAPIPAPFAPAAGDPEPSPESEE